MRRKMYIALFMLIGAACSTHQNSDARPSGEPVAASTPGVEAGDVDAIAREQMVSEQIAARGIEDPAILAAMREVRRHEFMPDAVREHAYEDTPVPIGHGQTISQPFIVAAMTDLLDVEKGHEVLEIGTGSGYQAAVLAELGAHVYSIEIVCELANRATRTLKDQGYEEVRVRCGDGYEGWPEEAPFDRIIVTAAPPEIPEALVEQLRPGGKMVVPVGETNQELEILVKDEMGDVAVRKIFPVRFVPMVRGADDAD